MNMIIKHVLVVGHCNNMASKHPSPSLPSNVFTFTQMSPSSQLCSFYAGHLEQCKKGLAQYFCREYLQVRLDKGTFCLIYY